MYSIREVNPQDESVREALIEADLTCFRDTAWELRNRDLDEALWWICYDLETDGAIAGYAAIKQSAKFGDCAYLFRAGVLPEYRGQGLQRRFLRVREAKARREGWVWAVTDCTADNLASCNSLISGGYKLYMPTRPWGLRGALYWRKHLYGQN